METQVSREEAVLGQDTCSTGDPGELLIKSQGLVAVVLIDRVICGALSVQLRDTQVKYCRSTTSRGWLEALVLSPET